MMIRTRLTVLFAVIVSTLMAAFCAVIYFEGEWHRRNEFRTRLHQEALTAVELLFGKDTVSADLLKQLDKNQMTVLTQEEIIIYDYQNKIIYESGTDYLSVTPELLNRVRAEKEIYWREGNREIDGILYQNGEKKLVVFASAYDKYGFSKQRNLLLILVFGGLIMLFVVSVAGWFFADRTLKPINGIIAQIDDINASQLGLRLNEGAGKDEISQLAQRFNQMLNRLEEAFRAQRAFVSHASHELRTPLTSITGQIQVSLLAGDDADELRTMLESVLEDIQQLNQLTNGLLSLANIGLEEMSVGFTEVNIRELAKQVKDEVVKNHPTYQVHLNFDEVERWNLLDKPANEPLLKIALLNLMENGGKFSPKHEVWMRVKTAGNKVVLQFKNDGPPIPPEELGHIFQPFRRGSNSKNIKGHGIGLSLTERIARLHKGKLTVESDKQNGTIFTLSI
jgi:signal transduction histidine kinase